MTVSSRGLGTIDQPRLIEVRFDGRIYVIRDNKAASGIEALLQHLAVEAEHKCGGDIIVPVYLMEVGQKLIPVIRAVRTLTGQSLKEAKNFVVAASESPTRTLLGHYPLTDAKRIQDAFRSAGASVRIPSTLELLGREGASSDPEEES